MKNIYFVVMLLLCGLFLVGCVADETINMPGKSKVELYDLSKKTILVQGYTIIYEDNKLGVIQAVKTDRGGTFGAIQGSQSLAGQSTQLLSQVNAQGGMGGFYTSTPPGVKEMLTVSIKDEAIFIRVEDTGLGSCYESLNGAKNFLIE